MPANVDHYAKLQLIARQAGQRGYFTTAQAQAAGVSRARLSRLVAAGLVVRVAPRVYRFRVAAAASWKDSLAVEMLSTNGIARSLSATALYKISDPPARPSVLVARGSRPSDGDRASTRDLTKLEQVTVDGFRALAPTRAVLDAVHRVPEHKAVALIESAIVRNLVKPEELQRRATELAHGKRPGCAITLRILAGLHPELAHSRNEWEALVARRACEFGLDVPRLEYELWIDGRRYIADAAWPAQKVALEFDGRDPHMRRTVHDNDTVRRNDFTDAGWLRFGITASTLQHGEDRAFQQVARAIAARSA